VWNNSCGSYPWYENAIFTEWTPTEYEQSRQNYDSWQACYYECKSGYYWDYCDSVIWCASYPWYEHVSNYIDWSPTEVDQSRQNYDSWQACYYECQSGYYWDYCDTVIQCASNPWYEHAIYTEWSPTEVDQSWQNYDSWWACYYECESEYTWDYCDEFIW